MIFAGGIEAQSTIASPQSPVQLNFRKRANQKHRRLLAIVVVLSLVWCWDTISPWSGHAYAVDASQLWLPRNYYRHIKRLQKAAEVAEETQLCTFVIAGTLAQNRSTVEHPIFKITCRDQERLTFAFLVDGLSYEILNRPPPPTQEELQKEALNKKLEALWLNCYSQLERRTQGLRGLTWINNNGTSNVPEALVNNMDDIEFEVEFNASGKKGGVLHFRASCHYFEDNREINIYANVPELNLFAEMAAEMTGDDSELESEMDATEQ